MFNTVFLLIFFFIIYLLFINFILNLLKFLIDNVRSTIYNLKSWVLNRNELTILYKENFYAKKLNDNINKILKKTKEDILETNNIESNDIESNDIESNNIENEINPEKETFILQ